MRRAWVVAVASVLACAPEPGRSFPIGLVRPVSPRVESEAARLGLAVPEQPPSGAIVESAAAVNDGGGAAEVMADWETLRLVTAHAATKATGGVFFRLPAAPEGRDLLDYPEEWQAFARVVREFQAMRPVIEGGRLITPPCVNPSGVAARCWLHRGRRYVLLVNASDRPAELDADALEPWRALFEVRADARQLLEPCGAMRCLLPGRVLWLEGRLRS